MSSDSMCLTIFSFLGGLEGCAPCVVIETCIITKVSVIATPEAFRIHFEMGDKLQDQVLRIATKITCNITGSCGARNCQCNKTLCLYRQLGRQKV